MHVCCVFIKPFLILRRLKVVKSCSYRRHLFTCSATVTPSFQEMHKMLLWVRSRVKNPPNPVLALPQTTTRTHMNGRRRRKSSEKCFQTISAFVGHWFCFRSAQSSSSPCRYITIGRADPRFTQDGACAR